MDATRFVQACRDRVGAAGSRVVESRAAHLFARNTVASFFVFGLDVALLWALVEFVGVGYIPAATVAFLIAMTLHYVLSRIWIFQGTERGIARGYVYFMINTGVGLVITIGAFAALVEFTGIHYLIARVLASVAAGIVVFFLNAVFNFKAL